MALTELELKRCEHELGKFLERRRPPPQIRDEVDIGYRVEGQSVEIFEVRPEWKNPKRKREHPIAKATYVRTQKCWKVFWMRRDLKWHGYEPHPEVNTLAAFFKVVDRDEYCCFFG